MLVTALAPTIGYDAASKIARAAHKNGTSLKEEALASGKVTERESDAIVRPEKCWLQMNDLRRCFFAWRAIRSGRLALVSLSDSSRRHSSILA
jgi:hypothetical protein